MQKELCLENAFNDIRKTINIRLISPDLSKPVTNIVIPPVSILKSLNCDGGMPSLTDVDRDW